MTAGAGPATLDVPPGAGVSGIPSSIPVRSEGPLLWRVAGVVRTVRPHQWVKNVFVLAPVVFAKEIFDVALLGRASAAFAVFCLLAGAVYTMNDLGDVEADRQHPVKRHRPIASGRVPVAWARVMVYALVGLSLLGAITYEILKRREEAAAERSKENAKIAERTDMADAAAGLK